MPASAARTFGGCVGIDRSIIDVLLKIIYCGLLPAQKAPEINRSMKTTVIVVQVKVPVVLARSHSPVQRSADTRYIFLAGDDIDDPRGTFCIILGRRGSDHFYILDLVCRDRTQYVRDTCGSR